MSLERIVAVGLLTNRDVAMLGSTFDRLWSVEQAPCFTDLLKAIDQADGELPRGADAEERYNSPSAFSAT
jgi:hypothetical protein